MRVLLSAVGSRGDAQPFVALGVGLAAAGHAVTVNTHTRFQGLVEEAGPSDNPLAFAPLSDAILDFLDTDLGRDAIENATSPLGWGRTIVQSYRTISDAQRSMVDEAWAAAEEARPDVIVFHQKAFWGPAFAEALGGEAILATLQPVLAPTSDFPILGRGLPRWMGPIRPAYNRATYRLTRRLADWGMRGYLRDWHAAQRRTQHATLARADGAPLPILQAFSPHVVPATWPPHVATTGFWHLHRAGAWTPPADLMGFLDAGPPPVYIGFGSMKGKRGAERARAVVEAVELAGVRAVLALGWGGLDLDAAGLSPETLPATCFALRQAPHDWLFPHMAAVVHHGGAGTTAAGLRAGRPTVVCPFFVDQPFWGRRVHALGVGPEPLRQKVLTAEALAGRIREAVTSASIQRKATALGERLRAEDGVANAMAFVERVAASQRMDPFPNEGLKSPSASAGW